MVSKPIAALRNDVSTGVGHTPSCSHPGLVLTRYLKERASEEAAQELLTWVSESTATEAYRSAFTRWREMHRAATDRILFMGVAQEPIAVGLGQASTLEVGLSLHHTYGSPLLPATALKGLCRRALSRMAREHALPDEAADVVLGTTKAAGYGVFWDAWYDPLTSDQAARPFKREVLTVHHKDYYGASQRKWPTDFDDPTPVPYLVVRPGSCFLFVVQMPEENWLEFVKGALQWGLEHLGIGGKTNAGFGRLGEWADLPRPPRIETWSDCELIRKMEKGAVTVEVRGGPLSFIIPQNQWQPASKGWPDKWKEDFKKKNRAIATLRVERDGSRVKLLDVITDTVRF